jgi:RNA polymerase sigma-70 factor (ECF subfamily)
MTTAAAETDRGLVAAARRGDGDAFRTLTEPHRRALHVHCYRMLGSVHDADDAVQETMLRAWRRLETYAGRASVRAWLFGIATNACLDALRQRPRRLLPAAVAGAADPRAIPAPPLEIAWLEPYPDRLLDPQEAFDERERIRLAFVAAVQHLPPRQRAVLLLRDVLGWSAKEVAEQLDATVASVNAALARARSSLRHLPPDERPASEDEAAVVARYVAAWEAADVPALAALLSEDVRLAMPPTPSWYDGKASVSEFLEATFARFPHLHLVRTRANGSEAVAVYDGRDPLAIKVFELGRTGIREITGFADPRLFPRFGLPLHSAQRPRGLRS